MLVIDALARFLSKIIHPVGRLSPHFQLHPLPTPEHDSVCIQRGRPHSPARHDQPSRYRSYELEKSESQIRPARYKLSRVKKVERRTLNYNWVEDYNK
jgi:hypothetical protein